MATRFKVTATLAFVVGVQLIDCTNYNSVVCSFLNNKAHLAQVAISTVVAAEIKLPPVDSRLNAKSTFIPPKKGAPKSTQGSGTR